MIIEVHMKVYVYYNQPLPLLFGAIGITLGRHVFIAFPKDLAKETRVFHHEMVHVKQIADTGLVKWYLRYAIDFLKSYRKPGVSWKEAYLSIPAEIEAYKKQNTFEPPPEWVLVED